MTVTPLGGGRYAVENGSRRVLAYAVRRGAETWVFLDGRVYVSGGDEARTARGPRHDAAALSAPMPATVVSIAAAPGRQVAAGDVLVVLEAMKMELSIAAPYAGTVRAIRCRVGELVEPGVPLVEMDGGPAVPGPPG